MQQPRPSSQHLYKSREHDLLTLVTVYVLSDSYSVVETLHMRAYSIYADSSQELRHN